MNKIDELFENMELNEVSFDPSLSKEEKAEMKKLMNKNIAEFQKDRDKLLLQFQNLEKAVQSMIDRETERVENEKSDRWTPTQKLAKVKYAVSQGKLKLQKI
jgi:hypothetical protein